MNIRECKNILGFFERRANLSVYTEVHSYMERIQEGKRLCSEEKQETLWARLVRQLKEFLYRPKRVGSEDIQEEQGAKARGHMASWSGHIGLMVMVTVVLAGALMCSYRWGSASDKYDDTAEATAGGSDSGLYEQIESVIMPVLATQSNAGELVVKMSANLPKAFSNTGFKVVNIPVTDESSLTVMVNPDSTKVKDLGAQVYSLRSTEGETARTYDLSVGNLVATIESTQDGLLALNSAIGHYLLDTEQVDEGYEGCVVAVSGNDRWVLEHLVMGEAGNQGFEGAALVAQCIRDAMVYDGYETVESVRISMKYSGSLSNEPNQDVKDAVEYVFDKGGSAVQHRILYFYSGWEQGRSEGFHETQNFIIQYGGHRFFDRWA